MSEVSPILFVGGLDADQQELFAEYTAAMVSSAVRLIVLTETEASLTVQQAWNLPHRHNWAASSLMPAVAICTNIPGAEISKLMDACRDSALPSLIWAIGRQNIAMRTMGDYLQELMAERKEFARAANWTKKGGS